MVKLDFNRVVRLAVITVSLCVIAGGALVLWQASRTQHLTMAAGAPGGESYIFGDALKNVVERHNPRIRITLLKTGGTEGTCAQDEMKIPSRDMHAMTHRNGTTARNKNA